MPSAALLDVPAARPVHHLPRRDETATSVLRALGTGPVPVVGAEGASPRTDGPSATTPQVRSLRLRDVATGGAAAAGSWTIAAHLGVLGTAGGTFLVSAVSTVLVALASDSLGGARALLLRLVRRARQHPGRR